MKHSRPRHSDTSLCANFDDPESQLLRVLMVPLVCLAVWYGASPKDENAPLGVAGQLQPNEDDIANGRRMH